MKIGLITGNHLRHNALGSYLNQSGYEVIQVSEINESNKSTDPVFEKYFRSVQKAEETLFDSMEWQQHIEDKISLKKGELNSIPNSINPLFSCDFIIVYGSSFIKGELYDLLSKKNTINLHIGISPQYTGSACNFWAMFDDNLHLVGGTIQELSKNLDEGRILKYCYPEINKQDFNPFLFSMESVKKTFIGVEDVLKNFKNYIEDSKLNDANKLIRHSKINDFNSEVISKFNNKKFILENIESLRQ